MRPVHHRGTRSGQPILSPSIDIVPAENIAAASPATTPEPAATDAAYHAHLVATGGDPTVRPQDDLYRHVNGRWLAEAEIPADRARYGEFHRLAEEAERDVRAIVEAADGSPEASLESRQVATLYASFMDTAAIEAAGTQPLEEDLALVAGAAGRTELARVIGALAATGVGGPFGLYVDTDAGDPDSYALHLYQSGLGLPDESYYRDEANAALREAYPGHVARQLVLATEADEPTAHARATAILALETRLAAGHWDRVKDRDAVATYNPTTRAELAVALDGFDLAAYAEGLGLTDAMLEHVVVREPDYLQAFAQAWREVDLETWRTWLAWRVVRSRAPYLTDAISAENFDFYGRRLTGAPQQRERWKRGVGFVEGAVGDAVARLYVAEHFPPEHKARMDALVQRLVEAYRVSIQDLEWMTPATREKALEKLAAFTPKIGYPARWKDYSDLAVGPDLLANVRAANRHETARELTKLGGPVDRDEWFMTPQTVNAYYNPGMNEIVFPAAILQPPFFSPDASDAANFGGIGAVIGHEIGHGFDDHGSEYDGAGRLVNWWSPEDKVEFERRTRALVDQYDAVRPTQLVEGPHVNGQLTLGENIGDLGGLGIAITAYRLARADRAASPEGTTDDDEAAGLRELFEAWGLIWRCKGRDAEVLRLLTVDPHSPEEFRCNGVVRNLDEFHEVYGVQPGDALWLEPSERVRIW
ncbi:peptidase M13 [Miniimonas arenae]|uniref:Peptidase M13 n=1 Tax=Miniimonas arenae TaxID=676201 RepID=A0A5C5BAT5_9MICO|nr:peptidase M13 [Miniimonas arenae]